MSATEIVSICEEVWPQDKGDCSAFARHVAKRLEVKLSGSADEIVDTIRSHWRRLPDGAAAKAAADAGEFIVAGLKGAEQHEPSAHGHIVVVVKGELAHGRYPTAYWGRLGDAGERNKTLNFAWRAEDRDRVTYAAAPDETSSQVREDAAESTPEEVSGDV
jgi:hypothetical protein